MTRNHSCSLNALVAARENHLGPMIPIHELIKARCIEVPVPLQLIINQENLQKRVYRHILPAVFTSSLIRVVYLADRLKSACSSNTIAQRLESCYVSQIRFLLWARIIHFQCADDESFMFFVI